MLCSQLGQLLPVAALHTRQLYLVCCLRCCKVGGHLLVCGLQGSQLLWLLLQLGRVCCRLLLQLGCVCCRPLPQLGRVCCHQSCHGLLVGGLQRLQLLLVIRGL